MKNGGSGIGGVHRKEWVGGQHGGRHIVWEAHTVGGQHVLGRQQVGEWRGWVGRHTVGLDLHPAAGAGQHSMADCGRYESSLSYLAQRPGLIGFQM